MNQVTLTSGRHSDKKDLSRLPGRILLRNPKAIDADWPERLAHFPQSQADSPMRIPILSEKENIFFLAFSFR